MVRSLENLPGSWLDLELDRKQGRSCCHFPWNQKCAFVQVGLYCVYVFDTMAFFSFSSLSGYSSCAIGIMAHGNSQLERGKKRKQRTEFTDDISYIIHFSYLRLSIGILWVLGTIRLPTQK